MRQDLEAFAAFEAVVSVRRARIRLFAVRGVMLATSDKGGRVPTLQQLPSNSPEAIIRLIEANAKLFSGSTGVPLNSFGIVQDNPSSAEAIAEARKDLTDEAQSLIEEQLIPSMRDVALTCRSTSTPTT